MAQSFSRDDVCLMLPKVVNPR